MKIIILALLLGANLLAYSKGDIISTEMAAHLGLKDSKIYIIDFFASWCSSCQKEIPLMSKLNTKLDKSQVELIGIDVDKDIKKGLEFQASLKEKGDLNFRVVNDPSNLVIGEFSPIGMPTLYYIKDKKVLGIITGAVDNIDERINNDLKKWSK